MRIIVAGPLRFAGDAETCAAIVTGGAVHIAASREEAGCVAYNWSIDPIDPGVIHVYEEWESEQALLRHFADPSYHAMRAHLESYELTGFAVQVYSVGAVEDVYDAQGRPRPALFGVSLS